MDSIVHRDFSRIIVDTRARINPRDSALTSLRTLETAHGHTNIWNHCRHGESPVLSQCRGHCYICLARRNCSSSTTNMCSEYANRRDMIPFLVSFSRRNFLTSGLQFYVLLHYRYVWARRGVSQLQATWCLQRVTCFRASILHRHGRELRATTGRPKWMNPEFDAIGINMPEQTPTLRMDWLARVL